MALVAEGVDAGVNPRAVVDDAVGELTGRLDTLARTDADGLGIGEGYVTLTDEAGLVVAVAILMRRAAA